MSTSFSLSDLRVMSDEPRLLDLKLAAALGFERPRNIRKLPQGTLVNPRSTESSHSPT